MFDWIARRKAKASGTELHPTPDSLGALLALNRKSSHIYAGTVSGNVKAKRRAANKVARASRRRNRK